MAVAIIIIATLSIVATVLATLALIPVIQEMGTDVGGHWDDTQALADQDCTGLPTVIDTPNQGQLGQTTTKRVCETQKDNAEKAIISRDRAFSAIIVLPIFLIGAIATWAFLAVTRRDFGEI
jgi:hypothetical protein